MLMFGLVTPIAANAAGSPTGAVAQPWPSVWNNYLLANGDIISDPNGDQSPSTLDLASGTCAVPATSCVGPEPTVMYYSDGLTAYFRMRVAVDLYDPSKGGLVGGAFLVQIADASDTVLAVVGVNGKSSSEDYVYIANAPGTNVTPVYVWPFDSSGGEASAGMRVVAVGDGSGQHFLDFQVPVSEITTVSGGAITTSTPIKMYYGSSAAANLATINKDHMLGTATTTDFSGLSTVTLTPASLELTSSALHASGPNPPSETATSTYTVTLTASNPGGGELTATTVSVPIPAGVTASSLATADGAFTGGGTSSLSWTPGTIPAGGAVTATFEASILPETGTAGTTLTLVSLQDAEGTDAPASATRTATAPAITVGPIGIAPTWTVAFDAQGGTAVSSQTVESNDFATSPTVPTRTGHTFDGWFTEASGGSLWDFATTEVTADTTLYAQWTPVDYTVSFDTQGGSAVAAQSVAYGTFATSPAAPTRTGYTFTGWFDAPTGGTAWDFDGTAITADTAIYAQWSAVDYVVTFDSHGGSSVSSQLVTHGELVSAPIDPTRYGYVFDGWFTEASGGTEWDFSTDTVTGATTLHAQWTLADFTVTFDSAGGSLVGDQTVPFGDFASEPADPTLGGFAFNGWYTAASGGTLFDFATMAIEADTTLYAQWAPIDYTVTFDSQGGTAVADATVANGEYVPAPTAPTRAGHTFDGWFTEGSGGTDWDFLADTVSGDTTLYAHWSAIDYTLVFDSQGGSAVDGQAVAYGDLASAPVVPTKYGNSFDGWYTSASGGSLWDFDSDPVLGGTTLYAQWTPVDFAVTYASQGGTAVAGEAVAYGALVTEPTDPMQVGYTFDGWYTSASGGALWDFAASTITADTTLYAQWTPLDYTVTFDAQGGTAVVVQTLPNGSLIAQPVPPTNGGFTLDGWYTASIMGTLWDFATDTITGDTTLYAQWIANTNTVTFDGQGGSFTPGVDVVTGDPVPEPVDPTRYGYTFDGWFDSSIDGALWDFATDTVSEDLILYAQWTVTDFNVTFDAQGGSAVVGEAVAYGALATEPADPTQAGYTFDGWYTSASGGALWDFAASVVTADTTLYAQWTPVNYTVTFESEGGSAVGAQTIPNGSFVAQPTPPARTGYAFDGWFDAATGGSAWAFGSDTVTSDTTLYAQWTATPLTLAFDSAGGTVVASQTVPYDTLGTEPVDPARSGFTFDGWFTVETGGVLWDFDADTLVADTTLYAQWTPLDYTLTFNGQGGSAVGSQTVAYGALVTEPIDPTRTGHTFYGWYTASTGGSPWNFASNTMTGDRTLYARWAAIDYAVTFDTQGGPAVAGQTVSYGDLAFEPSAPTRVGYTFDGWFDASSGGAEWDFATDAIATDTTIYAQWTVITNLVTFDSQGGSAVVDQVIDYGELVTEPADPTFEGYTFDGWFDSSSGGSAWDFTTAEVTSATTLYAQWTAITYTVDYDSQGGSAVGSEFVGYDALATEPADPTRTGYTFDGWYTASAGGVLWDFATDTLLADLTLYAQWTAIEYTVSFDSRGGSAVPSETVAFGGAVTEPTDPTRPGYTFNGWFDASSGGTLWDFGSTTVTSTMTLFAQWSVIDYAVTFDSQGGSAVGSETVNYDDLVPEPTEPTFVGYTFDGWFDASSGGALWDFGAEGVTEDLTLYAQWTEITFTSTFDSQGGSPVSSETVGYDALATEPADPTRTGHTFNGWYTVPSGGALWDFDSDSLLADTTLYAQWTPIDYTVTFSSTGGSAVSSETVAFGGAVTEPTDPTRSGYVFAGWFDASSGGTRWDFASGAIAGDLTLYAQWTELADVSFVSGVGTMPAQLVIVGGFAAAPPEPTRSGYTFVGWYTAPTGGDMWDFDADAVDRTLVLYARWEVIAEDVLAQTGDPLALQAQWALALFALGAMLLVAARRLRAWWLIPTGR
jgi:uncharacterized repeat protein (TIGR02543 family)